MYFNELFIYIYMKSLIFYSNLLERKKKLHNISWKLQRISLRCGGSAVERMVKQKFGIIGMFLLINITEVPKQGGQKVVLILFCLAEPSS